PAVRGRHEAPEGFIDQAEVRCAANEAASHQTPNDPPVLRVDQSLFREVAEDHPLVARAARPEGAVIALGALAELLEQLLATHPVPAEVDATGDLQQERIAAALLPQEGRLDDEALRRCCVETAPTQERLQQLAPNRAVAAVHGRPGPQVLFDEG